MGQVIPLPIEQTRSSRIVGADRPCEVLIFTGIRIERHDEAELALDVATPTPTRTGT